MIRAKSQKAKALPFYCLAAESEDPCNLLPTIDTVELS